MVEGLNGNGFVMFSTRTVIKTQGVLKYPDTRPVDRLLEALMLPPSFLENVEGIGKFYFEFKGTKATSIVYPSLACCLVDCWC